jgi:hypothetical protein
MDTLDTSQLPSNESPLITTAYIAMYCLGAAILLGMSIWALRGNKAKRKPTADELGISVIVCMALGLVAMFIQVQASMDARNDSFHAALQDQFGLSTTASLSDVKGAAAGNDTVVMTSGSEIFDVRPYEEHGILKLFRASDGKLIERSGD